MINFKDYFKLIFRSQLEQLVTFLRTIRDAASSNLMLTEDDVELSELNGLLSPLPAVVPGLPKMTSSTPSSTPVKMSTASKSDDSLVSMAATKKQLLTNKLSNVATTVTSRASALSSNMRLVTNYKILKSDHNKQFQKGNTLLIS